MSVCCYLSLRVGFNLPASGQLHVGISEAVQEGDEIAVVLVALEVPRVPPDLQDHVLQTRAVSEHAICTLSETESKRKRYAFSHTENAE